MQIKIGCKAKQNWDDYVESQFCRVQIWKDLNFPTRIIILEYKFGKTALISYY